MKRKEFLRTCGYGCLGVAALPLMLESCSTSRYVPGVVEGNRISVPLYTFDAAQKSGQSEFVVVENGRLQYPLLVVKENALQYRALVMKCTHRGTELQLFGDRLECPSHGSLFNTSGEAQNGPATESLQVLAVSIEGELLKIHLL